MYCLSIDQFFFEFLDAADEEEKTGVILKIYLRPAIHLLWNMRKWSQQTKSV